jgi:hypothetical protein
LHPPPDKLQDRTVLGFDPGTGLSVAIKVAVEDAATVDGTASCSRKLLVMVIAADTYRELSATLRAVSVTFGDAGKICGAV